MNINVRNLTPDDLGQMLALEQAAWPEDIRASEGQLRDRLRVFGRGVFGAFKGRQLVGMASSQIVNLTSDRYRSTWTKLTANGWISQTHDPGGNCLHCVSICVHPLFRNSGIGKDLNRARVGAAKEFDLKHLLTDTRLPGLATYLKEHPDCSPEEYVAQVMRREVREPAVNMYLSLGFEPLSLVPKSMESDHESADYGLAMIKHL